ncbi:MAG: outer membrane beta-barrel protein [Bradyrhizobium sp.]|uniref:outer membrane protein n=1 Tax=Bradyrhizobium sp. TaxID=376 RepID=UPI002724DDF6|nr:outer membrane beta-barrel protein [Bradyrhizobium sp.]MDO8398744.1 outer membrane beta-barrel protein [Bradyrhizobium sp.]
MQSKFIALLGGAALSLGLVNAASAADMAARPYTKAAPIAVAMYNWTGFYIGANGGWASSHKCWDYAGTVAAPLAVNLAEGCHDATGGTIGGQIGYNWQAGSWVFGLEAQGNWADLSGRNVSIAFPGFTNRSRIDAFGLFTGRVGYAWNNALLYVKGGAAVVSDKYNYYNTVTGVDVGTASETRWGGTVGVGLEYGFTPNWSFGVEYNHIFLDARNIAFASPAQTVDRIHQDVDMVTARINYRFGGPVVARY